MIVCPMPGYDYDSLTENGFSSFIGYLTGILAPVNSSQEKVNFNGTNNIDPVILSSKLKKIKNIDQILAKLIVTYISNEADFEEETIEGKNLRA